MTYRASRGRSSLERYATCTQHEGVVIISRLDLLWARPERADRMNPLPPTSVGNLMVVFGPLFSTYFLLFFFVVVVADERRRCLSTGGLLCL